MYQNIIHTTTPPKGISAINLKIYFRFIFKQQNPISQIYIQTTKPKLSDLYSNNKTQTLRFIFKQQNPNSQIYIQTTKPKISDLYSNNKTQNLGGYFIYLWFIS